MSRLIDRLEGTSKDVRGVVPDAAAGAEQAQRDPFVDLKFRVHEKLLKQMDTSKLAGRDKAELRQLVEEATRTILAAEEVALARDDRQRLIDEIVDEVL